MKIGVVVALVAACLAGVAGAASVGDVRVLVIRATWGPTVDDETALASAAPFYQRSSFGKLRLQLEITPWLHAYDAATCPGDQEAAKNAASAAGYDIASYQRIVEVLPADVCDFSGVARGNEALLTDPTVLVHELGHTFGLEHATSYTCGHHGCKIIDDYGDPLSPMGHGTLDFSAFEKLKLGWVTSVQRVGRSGAYAVADIDVPSDGPQALVVPTHAGEYWIEHRADTPQRVIVRLVSHGRTIFIGSPTARYVEPKVFSVTRAFRFAWLDRTRPTRPKLHALDATVVWWHRSTDLGSGIARYRVTIDGKLFTATTEPTVTLPDLTGPHRVGVVAEDRAGNRSLAGSVVLQFG